MKKNNLFSRIALLAAVFILSVFTFLGVGCTQSQEGESEGSVAWRTGFFTTVSLSLVSDNGEVSAVVRNDLTVGFSTVPVYVYLYSSEEYTDNIEDMQEEAVNDTRDLNIFHEIRATATTNGESKYWRAKVRYKSNENTWVEACTVPVLVDGRV